MLVRQDELDKDPTVRSRGYRGDIAGSTGKGRLSGGLPGGCRMASDLMDDAFGMSGYNPDAMDKVIQADGGQADTLFYKLTHACVYVFYRKGVRPSARSEAQNEARRMQRIIICISSDFFYCPITQKRPK